MFAQAHQGASLRSARLETHRLAQLACEAFGRSGTAHALYMDSTNGSAEARQLYAQWAGNVQTLSISFQPAADTSLDDWIGFLTQRTMARVSAEMAAGVFFFLNE